MLKHRRQILTIPDLINFSPATQCLVSFTPAAVIIDLVAFVDPDNRMTAEILQEAAEACFATCRKMVESLEC
jgi:hypothetical protein